jgi:putative membrane protein
VYSPDTSGLRKHRESLAKEEFPPMTSQRICKIATFSGAVLLTCMTALAQVSPGGMPPQPQQSPNSAASSSINNRDAMQQQSANAAAMADREFVKKAWEGSMAELQLGQLAEEKGSSDDVKQFGQQMVADHTKLGDEMKQVAMQMGVNQPSGLAKKDQQLVAKLNTLSGAEFDNAYIVAMVKDHKKDAEGFKSEAQQSQNPALQQVAQQGGQVIDHHLEMIDKIAESHNLMTSKGKLTSSGH